MVASILLEDNALETLIWFNHSVRKFCEFPCRTNKLSIWMKVGVMVPSRLDPRMNCLTFLWGGHFIYLQAQARVRQWYSSSKMANWRIKAKTYWHSDQNQSGSHLLLSSLFNNLWIKDMNANTAWGPSDKSCFLLKESGELWKQGKAICAKLLYRNQLIIIFKDQHVQQRYFIHFIYLRNTLEFRTNSVIFRTNPVIFKANLVQFKSNTIIIATNPVIFRI